MKKIIALLSLFALPVMAADVYMEADYQAIWDDLDQDISTVGAGVAFYPTPSLMIDVGADYVFNNDLGTNAFSYSRNESLIQTGDQYEDDWMAGVKVRWNFWSF